MAEADVDNLNAGGFFARYGREPNGPRPTVIPPHTTGGEPIEAKRPQGCHTTGGGTGKGAEGGEGK